ncbi:hypothetical protein KXS07_21990 [Inquilinus limosus]|uniref:hypothetical protein n=1 Tax=Inquilinus limosus TaxID=171674 RepID=UPI003F17D463
MKRHIEILPRNAAIVAEVPGQVESVMPPQTNGDKRRNGVRILISWTPIEDVGTPEAIIRRTAPPLLTPDGPMAASHGGMLDMEAQKSVFS